MEILECIKNRRSYRKFSDKKLEYDIIKGLLEISVCAPTAQMREPWGFVIIQDKKELKEISNIAKRDILEMIDDLPHFKKYEEWFRDPEYNIFYDAENLVVVYGDKSAHWYKEDCSCVTENIILAAFSKGIGTCWIGFGEHILNKLEIKEKYGVPESYEVVSSLIMGYISKESKPPKRKHPIIFNGETDRG